MDRPVEIVRKGRAARRRWPLNMAEWKRMGRGIAPAFPFSVILASPIHSKMFNVTLQDGLSIRTTGPAEPVTLEVRTPSVILTARLTAAGERVLLRVLQHRYDGTPLPDAPGVAAVPVPDPVSAP